MNLFFIVSAFIRWILFILAEYTIFLGTLRANVLGTGLLTHACLYVLSSNNFKFNHRRSRSVH